MCREGAEEVDARAHLVPLKREFLALAYPLSPLKDFEFAMLLFIVRVGRVFPELASVRKASMGEGDSHRGLRRRPAAAW